MANNNIKIELNRRIDGDGKVFLIGKVEAPMLIDCKDGATFLVFFSEENCEELQIACMDKRENSNKNNHR